MVRSLTIALLAMGLAGGACAQTANAPPRQGAIRLRAFAAALPRCAADQAAISVEEYRAERETHSSIECAPVRGWLVAEPQRACGRARTLGGCGTKWRLLGAGAAHRPGHRLPGMPFYAEDDHSLLVYNYPRGYESPMTCITYLTREIQMPKSAWSPLSHDLLSPDERVYDPVELPAAEVVMLLPLGRAEPEPMRICRTTD